LIRLENVTRCYGEFTAVDSVSFQIERGEIVGLLGHNGAGKTTVMKMLTGFLEPSAGLVSVDGLDIEKHRLEAQAKIGYLPENSPLYPDMSVIQYLEYVCELRSIAPEERRARIQKVIEQTALADKALSSIFTLSKGYKQRVGVAQAIIHQPEILILDEPTNGLDPSQIHEMRSLVKELAKEATVILSTHILQEVQAVCDRVIILVQGKLARDARLNELQSSNRMLLSIKGPEQDVRSKLRSVQGVSEISFLGNGGPASQFAVELSESVDSCAPKLAKTIVDAGWELYGLEPEQRTLETIFREINSEVGGRHAK